MRARIAIAANDQEIRAAVEEIRGKDSSLLTKCISNRVYRLFAERGVGLHTSQSAFEAFGDRCVCVTIKGLQNPKFRTFAMKRPARLGDGFGVVWRITNTPYELAEHTGITTKKEYVAFTRMLFDRGSKHDIVGGVASIRRFVRRAGGPLVDEERFADFYREYWEFCQNEDVVPSYRRGFGTDLDNNHDLFRCTGCEHGWRFDRVLDALCESGEGLPLGSSEQVDNFVGLAGGNEEIKAVAAKQ